MSLLSYWLWQNKEAGDVGAEILRSAGRSLGRSFGRRPLRPADSVTADEDFLPHRMRERASPRL
eukprot:1705921-Alexandrium_andersonii.AAC.1